MAIDGTQKIAQDTLWTEQCLERDLQRKQEDGSVASETQYYVYVLGANLAFANGMTIPLLSEFLTYEQYDRERDKQDCELKAFHRLAQRMKKCFPRLPILVLLDGLYPNGPVMELCRLYHWQFMIVLQDDALPSVWEEVRGLGQLQRDALPIIIWTLSIIPTYYVWHVRTVGRPWLVPDWIMVLEYGSVAVIAAIIALRRITRSAALHAQRTRQSEGNCTTCDSRIRGPLYVIHDDVRFIH